MINVYSEIGRLKKVLLHRPGAELNNLIPGLLEELLFDDIPWLEMAQKEHDAFADKFKELGVEVYYLEGLMADIVKDPKIKKEFLELFLDESKLYSSSKKQIVYEYLDSMDELEMIRKTMAGIRSTEITLNRVRLVDMIDTYPYVCDPMPNLYFTRDPFACIGDGVSINHMKTVTRNRETIYGHFIFKYHPEFSKTPQLYGRDNSLPIEGGDILVLTDKIVAIGVSERTRPEAVEIIAKKLFKTTDFETVLAIHIPSKRAFMHLDTVLTQVDYDKFTVHGGIEGPTDVYELKSDHGRIKIKKVNDTLENILSHYLEKKVTLIKCGGGDFIDSRREQWSDGANTLAIAPGEVIVYDRNSVTNKKLEEYGIKTHVIPSSELSRGRGGPRCMSMPLEREREEQ